MADLADPLFDAKLPADLPQLHVLLVGVSRYLNLPGIPEFDPNRARQTFSLGQLTSPNQSAAALADWFLGEHDNPDTLLGSVELLLSPAEYLPNDRAAAKLGVTSGSVVPVLPATFEAIAQVADRWFDRLDALRDNIGVFYFCGHGLEAGDRFLVAADFATNPADLDTGFINFQQTFMQMRRCQAATQYYLLDACRDSPAALLRAVRDGEVLGRPLLTRRGGLRPGRNAPLIQAAAPGKPAFGPPGQKSYFADALIKCLNGMAARAVGDPGFFSIDHASLALALPEYFSRLADHSELKDLRCHTDGSDAQLPGLPVLHRAAAPVEVMTRISCKPTVADRVAQLSVTDARGKKTPRPADALKPWRVTLRSGEYTVSATFAQGDGFVARDAVIDVVPTPTFDVLVRVQAPPAGGTSE